MVKVYIAPDVESVLALHPYLEEAGFRELPIAEQIDLQARTLHNAHGSGDERVAMQISSWWPNAAGQSRAELLATSFGLDDALLTLSREYGFADWQTVQRLDDRKVDPSFEAVLDAMLAGDLLKLQDLLEEMPALINARSTYGHQATLLHYLGANGVESYRQKTPLNAVALAELLVAKGARKNAEANMYGGGQTPFDLASTSAHPQHAGVSDALNLVLRPD